MATGNQSLFLLLVLYRVNLHQKKEAYKKLLVFKGYLLGNNCSLCIYSVSSLF